MRQNHLLTGCIVVMGVAGAGKTTLGKALAESLDGAFLDADTLHSQSSVEKMRKGQPLADADRIPWLEAICEYAAGHSGQRPLVIACSALKQSYRAKLAEADPTYVYLRGNLEEIANRLMSRTGHYFHPALLDSQFDDLEEPVDAIVVPVRWGLSKAVEHVREAFVR